MGQDDGASLRDRAAQSNPQAVSSKASIPSAVHIGVTGTQTPLPQKQKQAVGEILIGLHAGGAEWMHNGDCINADAHAGQVWKMIGGKLHLHPPTVRSKRAFMAAHAEEAPRPYLDRNSDIVNASEALVAMPKERHEEMRSGTWATVRRARKRRIPIIFVWPDGETSIEWPAQGMEAGTATTEGCGPKDDSPVGTMRPETQGIQP